MKKIKLFIVSILFFSFSTAFAGTIDHFDVKLGSDTTKIGEALDLSITAMDKDNNIVDDYLGTILVFSETDPKSELPNVLKESSYTFTLSDAGSVKFENAIIFNSEGTQDLHVYDLNDATDSVAGIAEVDVIKPDEIAGSEEISITSPENNATLTSNSVVVAGKTAANHRVIITISNKEFEAISNSDGIYEVNAKDLSDGDKTIAASVLDSDEKSIGKSDEIKIKISSSAPKILSITATPDEVYPETEVIVELRSQKGLEKVEVILNDKIIQLKEEDEGKYVGKLLSPAELGEYSIGATLQNDLGVKSQNKRATSIKVIAVPTAEVEVELNSAENANSKPDGSGISKDALKITGLKLTKLKTKSILTWDNIDIANYYNVYIKDGDEVILAEKVTDPRKTVFITGKDISFEDFAVKAIAIEKNNEDESTIVEGDLSKAIKIQTGPEKYLLLLLAAMIIGIIILSPKILFNKN